MIPDFKTYLRESTWGDMVRRAEGDAERREDDVNHLNRDEFYDYLKTRYSKLSHLISEDPSEIHITLGWSYYPKRDYKIDIHWVEQNEIKNLYLNFGPCELDSLCRKNFKIGTDNDGISNKEIISIIDFCLDYIKSHKYLESPIYESTWGDMVRRAEGDTVRREDDVDRFDYEEFFVYLIEHYQPKSKKINEKIGGRTSIIDTDIVEIFIPIESIYGRIKTLLIEMNKTDNSVVSMATSSTLFDKYVNLERMLSNNYTLTTSRLSSRIYLKPKKKPTNKTVVDLIDTFLVVVDNPILEKVS